MGQIANAANVVMLNQLKNHIQNDGQSSTVPMSEAFHKKEARKENAARARGIENGIRDSEDDWLSRQLKEEKEALYRMREMFGIGHFTSDAEKLKKEHERRHEAARRKGVAR